jgi:hypothetical protein
MRPYFNFPLEYHIRQVWLCLNGTALFENKKYHLYRFFRLQFNIILEINDFIFDW